MNASIRAAANKSRALMATGVLVLVQMWSGSAMGTAKTDVVVLINGDRITGEVKGLERGILRYSTDFMGTIEIDWDKVAKLSSQQYMEIETLDSRRSLGRPTELGDGGELRLEVNQGDPVEVSMSNVARIFVVDQGRFRDRIDGYVNFGWSAVAANNLSQVTVGAGLTYVDELRLWDFTYEGVHSESNTSPSTGSQYLRIDQQRFLRDDWFWTGGGNISRNDELGLDLRVLLGGGIGRYYFQTPYQEFFAALGIGVTKEKFADGQNQESFEGILTMSYDLYKFGFPDIDIAAELSIYPSLTVSGRVRTDAGIRMRYEIISDLYYELSAQHMYDSKPQSIGASDTDWSIVTSLGYSF